MLLFLLVAAYFFVLTLGQSPSTPHIVFIISDDLGWGDLSYHNAAYKTPYLDTLASQGIDLTNYYVHWVCTPSRSAFMNGRYAWKNGLQDVLKHGSIGHLPFDTPTMPELLKQSNYETHGMGTVHTLQYTPVAPYIVSCNVVPSHTHTNKTSRQMAFRLRSMEYDPYRKRI